MLSPSDAGNLEYTVLMERCRTIERTGITTWTIATSAALVMLAWGIADDSPGRMLAVVFAAAVALYPLIHARRQLRLMSGYLEEFVERRTPAIQWHTSLRRLEVVPTVNTTSDWILTALSNLVVIAAVIFSWMFADGADHGGVIAGFVTATGVIVGFHTIMETARIAQTDFAAVWRRVSQGPRETERRDRMAS